TGGKILLHADSDGNGTGSIVTGSVDGQHDVAGAAQLIALAGGSVGCRLVAGVCTANPLRTSAGSGGELLLAARAGHGAIYVTNSDGNLVINPIYSVAQQPGTLTAAVTTTDGPQSEAFVGGVQAAGDGVLTLGNVDLENPGREIILRAPLIGSGGTPPTE